MTDGRSYQPELEARRKRAEALYLRVLEFPVSMREEYLRRQATDVATRELVRDLLEREETGIEASPDSREGTDYGGYERAGEGSPRTKGPAAALLQRIGPYELVQVLGQGGMGTVYRGVQTEPIRRDVAIKVVRASMVGPQTLHRFEAERRALARMSHPNIAQVFEAGDTREGEPYFVMELVEGEPIVEFCDERRFDIDQRLELFIEVCKGIQHAHHKGVLHRDIKPQNILVVEHEGRPVPKIIDFGIAKLLESDAGQAEELKTERGVVVGTPAYISPEALLEPHEEVDSRSDVYSLGVLLFELLTGVRPHGRPGDSIITVIQRVSQGEAPAPSIRFRGLSARAQESRADDRSMTPRSLIRGLKGDLDWITQKAMDRERKRRYSSASEFAADLERHLNDQVVTAGPPGGLYRLGKLIRRHKGAAAALVLLFLTLMAGIFARTLEAQRANREAETARMAAREAQEVADFLVHLFRVTDPYESRGETVTARELLDRGAEEIRERLSDQPVTRARLLETMGRAYQELGLLDPAQSLLEETLAVRLRELGDDSVEVASSLRGLGHLAWLRGDYPLAVEQLQGALDLLAAADAPEDLTLASVLDDLGSAHEIQAHFAEAEPLLRRALAIRERIAGLDSLEVAASFDDLAVFFADQRKAEQAMVFAQEALDIRRRKLGEDHPEVAVSANTLAINLFALDRLDDAAVLYEKALVIRRQTLPEGHPDIGQSLNNLANVYLAQGRVDEGETLLLEARTIWEAALGQEHRRVGVVHHNLGDLATDRERWSEAEDFYRRAAAIFRKSLGPLHPDLSYSLKGLGDALHHQGEVVQAREAYEEALAIRERSMSDQTELVDEVREALARLPDLD
jgi:non-specific serine/threonine protein kinase/serine/threonine-protein kinase